MPGPLQLLAIVAPIFLLMTAGFGLRKLRVLTEEADQSLLGVVVKLLIPCLALDVIIGNEALNKPQNLLLPPLLGFATIALGLGVCILGARLFFKNDVKVRRTFVHAAGVQNYGYLALPLCEALFGRETVGVLFAFNLGVELAFWSIAVTVLTGRTRREDWLHAINPPIIAVAAAIALNLAGAGSWIPTFLDSTLHMLGGCAVPLGLIVTGALLADYASLENLRAGWRVIFSAIFLRLGILPLLIFAAAWLLPIDQEIKRVLVIQAAMPAAVFPIIMTRLFNGDMPTAVRVVISTQIVGLITIPLWLAFGLHIILHG